MGNKSSKKGTVKQQSQTVDEGDYQGNRTTVARGVDAQHEDIESQSTRLTDHTTANAEVCDDEHECTPENLDPPELFSVLKEETTEEEHNRVKFQALLHDHPTCHGDPPQCTDDDVTGDEATGEDELVAICDFNSSMPNDLSFKRGDRFKKLSTSCRDASWWFVKDEANLFGNVPQNYLAHSESLFVHDWYHGNISEAEARARLTSPGNSAGSYLVRENGPGYILTVLTKVEGQNQLITRSREIEQTSDGNYQMHPLELTFSNIAEVIIHCKIATAERPDLGQPLRKACRRKTPEIPDLCGDYQGRLEIPAADFKKERKLAKGNFANVWQGLWRNKIVVALKILKRGRWTEEHVNGAIAVMRTLQHPNIVRLYGVYHMESLILVTELLQHGSLRDYLRSEESSSISYQEVLDFAKQIACGMAYLETKGVIHRDLAAKNVLVGADKTAKVADCGLVRAVDDDYVEEGGVFPYRWSAPEVIRQKKYSSKSDVWAFGILLVELTTHGQLPYKDLSVSEVLRGAIIGVMHERPTECAWELYHLMMSCWATNYIERPKFQVIITKLDTLISDQNYMLPTAASGQDHRQDKDHRKDKDHRQNKTACAVSGGAIVLCLFSYTARSADEISFSRGDSLELISELSGRGAEETTSTYVNTGWDAWRLAQHLGNGERGFIPSNYVTHATDMIAEDWFHPDITGVEAVQILNATTNAPGEFLIRKSRSEDCFVLSMKDENGTIRHYMIISETNGRVQIAGGVSFNDLLALVQYYRAYPGLCCQLSSACRVQRPATQELSPANLQDGFELNRACLQMETKLASGHFGEVWKGLAYGTVPVAVKRSKPNIMSREEFMKEATIMKKLHHPSLVQLYGVCSDDPIWIVTEFAENGSLLEYLREDEGPGYRISQTAMIFIAQQVAAGMAYLAERTYIHRDLAARNVLVCNVYQVKIADFGLARAIPGAVYISQAKNMPIRWTAPEGLSHGRYSVQSDVWSFGILLVEIFTHGATPYQEQTTKEVFNFVCNGGRHGQPKPECPDDIYQSMLLCWEARPEDRPSFHELLAEMDAKLRKAHTEEYHKVEN